MQQVQSEYPAWRVWSGVGGMCYASRRVGIRNVTLRAHNWDVLAKRLALAETTIRRQS